MGLKSAIPDRDSLCNTRHLCQKVVSVEKKVLSQPYAHRMHVYRIALHAYMYCELYTQITIPPIDEQGNPSTACSFYPRTCCNTSWVVILTFPSLLRGSVMSVSRWRANLGSTQIPKFWYTIKHSDFTRAEIYPCKYPVQNPASFTGGLYSPPRIPHHSDAECHGVRANFCGVQVSPHGLAGANLAGTPMYRARTPCGVRAFYSDSARTGVGLVRTRTRAESEDWNWSAWTLLSDWVHKNWTQPEIEPTISRLSCDLVSTINHFAKWSLKWAVLSR